MSLLNDEYYSSKWKSIVSIFQKTDIGIAAQAKAGSRARQTHTCKSDLDVIFFASGDPSRAGFYPDLIHVLRNNFQEAHDHRVYPGSKNNVVHLVTARGGVFDFVLLTETEFEDQHGNNVEWRRDNL